ncbi:phospholipase D alpha 2-like [Panicum virgatum]|uniref:Phospholipase D n=1 Tax=Panicum virgatum TaxID=38727 RepID=A0A8T0PZI0_PANVG|nr:phospholipase D alpha 2-like [Panicum virgatum]KAG2563444.1 hypothetical protein PVAP13_8KG382602 [Panicum virgatum]
MAAMLLHGTLEATIFEAKFNIPGSKFLDALLPRVEGLPTGRPQLYATVDLAGARVGRTRVVVDGDPGNPRWDEPFHIYCAHVTADVIFSVKARLPVDAALVGRAYVPVQDLAGPKEGRLVDRWLDILGEGRRPLPNGPKLHVQVRFTGAAADPRWGSGVGGGAVQFPGVPRTFFKQRQGCRVTLYQDAHVPDAFRPPAIEVAGGVRAYEPRRRCWEDLYDAISGARHLVYVTGWSVSPHITLARDAGRPHPGGGVTLGELLKRKAGEGVRVLMLVWDDPTSVLNLGVIPGQMGTNDADTFSYFRGSRVQCVPCPRSPDDAASFAQGLKTLAFSHHQKSVVVDVAGDGGRRRVACFVGGLDLTNGRYDTPEHSLFRTLNTAHSDDFYQGNIPGAAIGSGGPREPWHDIHCRIDGPAAWDVLHNFEQRWRKQGGRDDLVHSLLSPWKKNEDVLVDLRGMEDAVAPQTSPAAPAGDEEAWNVQVFRSIDSSACAGFPKTPAEAAASGLVSGKDHIIERSIQDAYIHAIRRARRFVYIENQYFLGSSFGWRLPDGETPENIGALHLIPRELSLKVVSKIEAGERFAVYVVLPMWPEGDPSGWTVQAILHWQRKTMEMMYADIAAALRAKSIDADPKDYLSFFCLGNREAKLEVPREYEPKGHPPRGSDYERAQKARRAMVYVHSKLMIVDDEYIIIGSANINQRSMDGGRDTEIAMGAYQPPHLNAGDGEVARGKVHGFRMSLWYEHLAELRDEFRDPGSLECVRMVNRMASELWRRYAGDELDGDLRGHLFSYPVDVARDGTVKALKGAESFPDTDAPVLGSLSLVVSVGSPLTNYILTA